MTWYKDLVPLPASSRLETDYNLSSGIAILKIISTLKSDLGDYLCLSENKVGEDMTSCNLSLDLVPNVDVNSMMNPDAFAYLEHAPKTHINPNLNETLIPPRVIIPLSHVKIEEGKQFKMACKIDGLPKPKVSYI